MANTHEIRNKQKIKLLFASVPQTLLPADMKRDLSNAYIDNKLQANSVVINIACLFVCFF